MKRVFTEEHRRNMSIAATGRKHTAETRKKLSVINTGKPGAHTGFKHSEEAKLKMSIARKGKFSKEKHPNWIADRDKLKDYFRDERRSSKYNTWRNDVRNRDKWKCRIDDKNCSGKIEVHHILGWTEYPELRYRINNGITLCHAHHPKKRAEEKRLSPFFQELINQEF